MRELRELCPPLLLVWLPFVWRLRPVAERPELADRVGLIDFQRPLLAKSLEQGLLREEIARESSRHRITYARNLPAELGSRPRFLSGAEKRAESGLN